MKALSMNICMSVESLLNLNWSDLSWFQQTNTILSEETALPYFCQMGNPFYDRSSLNERLYMNNLTAEAMVRSCFSLHSSDLYLLSV